jgi:hypothetical protein
MTTKQRFVLHTEQLCMFHCGDIQGTHSSVTKDLRLLECDDVLFVQFVKTALLSSSGSSNGRNGAGWVRLS